MPEMTKPSAISCSDRSKVGDAPNRIVRPRQQLMLDQAVQGMLINRVILYWLVCLVATGAASCVWSICTDLNPPPIRVTIGRLVPAWLGSLIFLPLCLNDVLRQSHRFVGPVLRLRNAMKCLQLGDPVPPLQTRPNDYWGDLLDRFNRLLPAQKAHHDQAPD